MSVLVLASNNAHKLEEVGRAVEEAERVYDLNLAAELRFNGGGFASFNGTAFGAVEDAHTPTAAGEQAAFAVARADAVVVVPMDARHHLATNARGKVG